MAPASEQTQSNCCSDDKGSQIQPATVYARFRLTIIRLYVLWGAVLEVRLASDTDRSTIMMIIASKCCCRLDVRCAIIVPWASTVIQSWTHVVGPQPAKAQQTCKMGKLCCFCWLSSQTCHSRQRQCLQDNRSGVWWMRCSPNWRMLYALDMATTDKQLHYRQHQLQQQEHDTVLP